MKKPMKITGVTIREKYTAPEAKHNIIIAEILEDNLIYNDNFDDLAEGIRLTIAKFGLKYSVKASIENKNLFIYSKKKNTNETNVSRVENETIQNRRWSILSKEITQHLNKAGVIGEVGYRIKGKYVEFYI